MRRMTGRDVVLRGARTVANMLVLASVMALTATVRAQHVDLGVTFSAERAKVATAGTPALWLRGGSADIAVGVVRGFGIAASVTGAHIANLTPGVNLGKLSVMAGPRFTMALERGPKKHTPQIFAEALIGLAHGFDAAFPSGTSAVRPTANSLSLQVGGAVTLPLGQHIGLRMIEADYVRTTLPNNAANVQNDLRLAAGMSFHVGRQ